MLYLVDYHDIIINSAPIRGSGGGGEVKDPVADFPTRETRTVEASSCFWTPGTNLPQPRNPCVDVRTFA